LAGGHQGLSMMIPTQGWMNLVSSLSQFIVWDFIRKIYYIQGFLIKLPFSSAGANPRLELGLGLGTESDDLDLTLSLKPSSLKGA
jgi:hypothetical protein